MSLDKPVISVIIPVYNAQGFIRETLNAVIEQNYEAWECILVDDGSSDDSINIIQEYLTIHPQFQFYERPLALKKGPSSCRNIGISKAKGTYIIFLDADDLLSETAMSSRLRFANEYPEVDFWIFKMNTFRDNPEESVPFNALEDVPKNNEVQFYVSKLENFDVPFPITSIFWNSKKLKELNGFDEELFAFEDPDLAWRAFQNNFTTKTADVLPEDCYYRLPALGTKANLSKVKKQSILRYFYKHVNKTTHKKIFFKRLLSNYGLSNASLGFIMQIIALGRQTKCISFWKGCQILFLWWYRKLGAHRIKGSGYTQLQKSIFNSLV